MVVLMLESSAHTERSEEIKGMQMDAFSFVECAS